MAAAGTDVSAAGPAIDGARLASALDALAAIGASGGGVTRVAYSPDDLRARAWVRAQLSELGLDVRVDAAGSTIAVLAGTQEGLAPIGVGSHTDTVPDGGRFDGALGVAAAIACVSALAGSGRLRHPVAVIDFEAEEATMGGATFASRAMAGTLDDGAIDRLAYDGRPVREHLRRAGLDPEGLAEARLDPGAFAAFLELHIEQGRVLEAAGVPIGVVEGIAGIRRLAVTFTGTAGHAGTTPMDARDDALVAAAPFVIAVRDAAVRHGVVATVGTLRVHPGAPNVVPGRVDLDVELRGTSVDRVAAAEADLLELAGTARATATRVSQKPPVAFSPMLLDCLEDVCRSAGVASLRLSSGAGHDAGVLATITDAAMLFVPSRHGISHSPDEHTGSDDCVRGAQALLDWLVAVDAALD